MKNKLTNNIMAMHLEIKEQEDKMNKKENKEKQTAQLKVRASNCFQGQLMSLSQANISLVNAKKSLFVLSIHCILLLHTNNLYKQQSG